MDRERNGWTGQEKRKSKRVSDTANLDARLFYFTMTHGLNVLC